MTDIFKNVPKRGDKRYAFNLEEDVILEKKSYKDPDNKPDARSLYLARLKREREEFIIIEEAKETKCPALKTSAIMNGKSIEASEIAVRSHALTQANCELNRFSIGSPQYYFVGNSLASEYIPGFTPLIKKFKNKCNCAPQNVPIYEDMGRIVLSSWVYEEDDPNYSNLGIDEQGKIRKIDHVRTLGSVTIPFLNIPGEANLEAMGELHEYDFAILPEVYYRSATGWDFNNHSYSSAIRQHPRFQKEKCLQTLKELITQDITKEFYNIHIEHSDDLKKVTALLGKNINLLTKIASNSKPFITYLQNFGEDAIKIIFYEVREFICKSKHYREQDAKQDSQQWLQICDSLFLHLGVIKKTIKEKMNLDLKFDLDKLKEYTKQLSSDDSDILQTYAETVRSCYLKQDMTIRATNVDYQLLSFDSKNREFSLADTTGLQQYSQFARKDLKQPLLQTQESQGINCCIL